MVEQTESLDTLWHDWAEERKARHSRWFEANMAEIRASGLTFTPKSNSTVLLFREPGKPKVDFYPHTGRWRVPGQPPTFRGQAKAFLTWYGKQET